MAIVLRYVNSHGEAIERFVGVVHVSNTSALSLKGAIDDFFANNGLSLSRLRGQGYDGASNMRGELNGLKTLILNENPYAKYIYCFAHRLQLVVVAVVGANCDVSDCFEYISGIINLVGASCKRKDDLRQKQHDHLVAQLHKNEISTGKGLNQETTLSQPGDTRLGSHHRTLLSLLSMWDPVMKVLININVDEEQHNRGKALGLMDKMKTYEFVFIAHFMCDMLGITNGLSQLLQQKDQNIGNAITMIKTVKDGLQEMRDRGWDNLLKEVNKFCCNHQVLVPNIEENMPDRVNFRHEGQHVTYLHHFRVNIFYQVIDLISEEMNNHFIESTSELLMCITCLDPRNSFAMFDNSNLLCMAEFYPEDFSHTYQIELKQQLKLYFCELKGKSELCALHDIGGLAKKMVENNYHIVFPMVYKLLELTLVLPVATATVERLSPR